MAPSISANFKIPPDQWEALKARANARDSNASQVIKRLIEAYLEGDTDDYLDTPADYFYSLGIKDRVTGEVTGWIRESSAGEVEWITEPFEASEIPAKLTLERISEIIDKFAIDKSARWFFNTYQHRITRGKAHKKPTK